MPVCKNIRGKRMSKSRGNTFQSKCRKPSRDTLVDWGAHCEARKIEPATLLNMRLYPDDVPVRSLGAATPPNPGL
jgi:hypothetical protein